ncbi:MAG: 2-thiouracil desulfurase family protein, partial [Planctomycetota bacterium]
MATNRRKNADRGPIRVGVSACLLGEKVRFDGDHKRAAYVADVLGEHLELVSVCPEVELGLSVPRPTLRLERAGTDVALVMPHTGRNLSRKMRSYARAKVTLESKEGLSGFVLKARSPSCGLQTRAYTASGRRARSAPGLFAEVLLRHLPDLPAIDEEALDDPRRRENWIQRLFAYRRLQELWATRWKIEHLIAFHADHKLLLLAHAPRAYQPL